MILAIPSHDAWKVWPEVEPILQRAVERTRGRVSTEAVFSLIRDRRMQLWIAGEPIESVAVTELLCYPHAKACRIVMAAGELNPILAGAVMVENWAFDQGCQSIEIEGRPGWERVARGYEFESVILRKELR